MPRPRRIALMVLLIGVALSNASCGGQNRQDAAQNRQALGTRLVNRYLSDLQRQDVADLSKFVSPAYQVQRADGRRQTKSELLRNPPKLGGYVIRDMRVTSGADVLVATFEVATNEVIHGRRFRTSYAARMAVFVAVSKGWQLIAYANFNVPT